MPEKIEGALRTLDASTNQFHGPALAMVGDLLRRGTFTTRDVAKARKFYTAAG